MSEQPSPNDIWTPEQIELAKRWVETWKRAAPELKAIEDRELQELDTYQAIQLLCGPADYTRPPRAPLPTSGLIEMQAKFRRLVRDE